MEQQVIRPKSYRFNSTFVRVDTVKWFEISYDYEDNIDSIDIGLLFFSLYAWDTEYKNDYRRVTSHSMRVYRHYRFIAYYEFEDTQKLGRFILL